MSQDLFYNTWRDFLEQMRAKISFNSTYLWFGEAIPIVVQNGTFFLVLDSDFKRDVLLRRYKNELESFFTHAYGTPVSLCLLTEREGLNIVSYAENRPMYEEMAKAVMEAVESGDDTRFVSKQDEELVEVTPILPTVQEQPTQDMFTPSQPIFTPPFVPEVKQEPQEAPSQMDFVDLASQKPQLQFTQESTLSTTDENGNHLDFEHFVVGSSNKFAHAACMAVAREPAKQYNPLFIYGQSGLGKTHLLKSIIRYLQLHHPELKIRYVKGDEFTNQMIESLSFNRTEQFRENYRKVDVLLIDDIQFIAGKASTQEEFFHTFNALYEDQKQIILTSDRPPKDIPRLEERLRTRFEWGLTADIQPPDLELRVAILKNKCMDYGISLTPDILTAIAENLRNNVRQLEGAVKKIAAQTLLLGQQVTKDLALSCISDFMSASEPVAMTADKILTQIADRYEISLEDLKSTKRTKQIAMPRHIAIYLIREMTNMSFPQLGKFFGRDHTTVLNSYQTVEEKMKSDPFFEGEIKELLRELQGN